MNIKTKKPKIKKLNAGEETLALQLKAYKVNFEREYRFCPERRWRADFYLPDYNLLVEVEGAIWTGGRHTRPKGFLADIEKYNTAQSLGFKILRVTPQAVKSGEAIKEIRQFLKGLLVS